MTPYGVSPGKVTESVKADTGTIFKYPYTGLMNVGLGTRTYVLVTSKGFKLSNPTMGTVAIPSTSGGASKVFGSKLKLNDSNYVFTFTPDVLGSFQIKVTDGSYTTSLTFNSAKYLGVDNKGTAGVNCQSCHPTYYTNWKTTGHSNFLTRALDGSVSSHYTSSCISCHTVGYDKNPTAKNDGFDDFTFVFPTTLQAGVAAATAATYPDAMARANIQCESCHGPGSSHYGGVTGSRMQASYDAAVCEYCHQDASHHVHGEQYDVSGHANPVDESGNASCVPCHTGKGFAQVKMGIATSDPYFDKSFSAISCAGCHDPHNTTNQYQLRTVTATATDNTTQVAKGGLGRICMNCHKARTVANDAYVAATSFSRFGPHHSPATEVFFGQNFYTFGKTFPQSKHADLMADGCVTCHMAATDNGTNGRPKLMGNHTFSMTSPTGESNMTACASCHGYSLGQNFSEVKFYINGSGTLSGDFDGDGTVNGLQTEVLGYINKIFALLPAGTPAGAAILSTRPTASWTTVQKQVLWNLYMLLEDKSYGMHNPKFTFYILNESYKQLGGIPTAISEEQNTIPTNYALFQNYPNPFNPTTNIKFSLPKESKVKLTIYDAIGKQITVLVDGQMSAGSHVVQWNATNFASGVYFYRIEADNFRMTNKMLFMK
jgi:hypothetical protein